MLQKAAECQTGQGGDNCTKWFLTIIAIIKTPSAMRGRQAAVIGQNAATIQGFGARYGRARRAARDNALSYTVRTLVLHEKSACPTRMVSLSYTEKRIFPLHGAEGVTQGNSTDPIRLTKAAKCQTGQCAITAQNGFWQLWQL